MDTRTLVMLLCVAVALALLPGCSKDRGFYDPSSGALITPEQHELLSVEDQAAYAEVEVELIDPAVASKIDAGVAVGTTSLQLVRPFIPEPFVTGAVALLGIISAVWLKIKEARVTDILSKVKLGAVITAGTVDALVKADPAMWAMFKKQQEKSSAGTGAIMPDKLVIETL